MRVVSPARELELEVHLRLASSTSKAPRLSWTGDLDSLTLNAARSIFPAHACSHPLQQSCYVTTVQHTNCSRCRQNGATVFLGAFRVRLKRVLRRSVDGPEPGRGQGLGAPWTPPPTRCERPGREYLIRSLVPLWRLRPRT
ncbi:unnamed protein product [Parnassius apollo]|uniref:(apollo) hypothetical protein n=1 Tax=Parnassius apollo TaxID=110799 RepID=A0A8S3X0S9_PARAO|nr:unnamed protein product [Parnassius apollo]